MSVLNLGGLIQWYLCEIDWENMVEFLQKQKISGSQCTRQILIPICVLNFFFLRVTSYLIFNSKSSWSSTSGRHCPWIRVFLYRSDPSRWLYIYVYTLEGSHWSRVGCSQDLVPEYHYPLFTSANRAKLVPSSLLSRQAGWSAQLPIEQNVIAYLSLFRSSDLSPYLSIYSLHTDRYLSPFEPF